MKTFPERHAVHIRLSATGQPGHEETGGNRSHCGNEIRPAPARVNQGLT
ncbi:hypothetical protein [Acetobacter estunensis]|nr:hypothetical protein [Acetobacter estunensis]